MTLEHPRFEDVGVGRVSGGGNSGALPDCEQKRERADPEIAGRGKETYSNLAWENYTEVGLCTG